jgi:hypothetical protein
MVRLWSLWAAKEAAFKVGAKCWAATVFAPGALHAALTLVPEPGVGGKAAGSRDDDAAAGVVRVSGTVAEGPLGEPVHVSGIVSGGPLAAPVRVEGGSDGSYVHVAGWSPGDDVPPPWRMEVGIEAVTEPEGPVESEALEGYRERFTAAEWAGIHSVSSARVRLLARARLREMVGLAEAPVEIVTSGEKPGRTPPRVLVGGSEHPELDVSLSHHGRFLAWAILAPPRA